MNICIIFPPVSDPRGPHLAPAALAAALRKAGHRVAVKDLDLEMALYLLQPEILQEHLIKARDRLKSLDIYGAQADWQTLAWRQKISQCIDGAQGCIAGIDDHISLLRSDGFYDPARYFAARRAIDACLALVCSSYDYELTYRMDGQTFLTRYHENRLRELLQAISDHAANLFGSLYPHRIIPQLAADKPDLICICILNYQQIIPGLTLAKQLKESGMRVVVGGTVYSKFVESLAAAPAFFSMCDAVVVYEGETALVRLAEELGSSTPDLSRVPNLIWRDGSSVRVNRPFSAEDLCLLPTPDFTGFPLERYLAPVPVLPYNLGKGCYWNKCLFCEIPHINNLPGTEYRVKPARLIVDQLEELSEKFKTPCFQFTDESCQPELLEELTDIILERNLKIYYLCYARLESAFTVERLKKLRKGGLRKLMFGLESGSDRTLHRINKGISAAQAETVMANCRQAGVNFRLFVILGFPGETLEDAWETRAFLQRVSPLLRDPLNSFEVNLFHLDTLSCFGKNLEKFNIKISEREPGEFYLGGDRFSCPEGMDKRTLHQFIKEVRKEMYPLADMRAKHSGWEEYSLLNVCKATA